MNNNLKMALGCVGIATILIGSVIGRKINERNAEPKLDGDLSKQFDELKRKRSNKYYVFNRNKL